MLLLPRQRIRLTSCVAVVLLAKSTATLAQCPDGAQPRTDGSCAPRATTSKAPTLRTVANGQPRLTAVYENVPLRAVRMELARLVRRTIVASAAADSVLMTVVINDQPWDVALLGMLNAKGLNAVEEQSGIITIKTHSEFAADQAAIPVVARALKLERPPGRVAAIARPMLSDRGRLEVDTINGGVIIYERSDLIDRVVGAIQELDRRLREPPDSIRVLYERAITEARRRTPDGAREAFDLLSRVIRADSSFAPHWVALARLSHMAWIRRWDIGGADRDSVLILTIRASRRALQLDSTLADAWITFARAAGAVDVTERGATRNALSRALAIDPRNVEALFELGLMEEELLRPAAAASAYGRALAISPTHLESLAFLANNHLWRSDYATARRFADSALAIDPTYSVAREAAAEIALAQRRWDDAERHATILRTTRGAQEPVLAYSYLARVAAARGSRVEGIRVLEQGEQLIRPDEPTRHAAVFLAAAWWQLGDTARALARLRAYAPRNDLHFQLHLKREPGLRWLPSVDPALLTPPPAP